MPPKGWTSGRPEGIVKAVRLSTAIIERIAQHVERLQAQLSFVHVNEGMAIRNLIEIGLNTVEAGAPPREAAESGQTPLHEPQAPPAQTQETPSHLDTVEEPEPAPAPTAQPAIPLALEPAPKTAHPVDMPQVSEAPTETQNGEADIPPYDTSKYILGKLCPRRHDYHGTGQSLRHLRRHVCLECDAEAARERRKARAARGPA